MLRFLGHFILTGIKFLSKKMLEVTENEYISDFLYPPVRVYTHSDLLFNYHVIHQKHNLIFTY